MAEKRCPAGSRKVKCSLTSDTLCQSCPVRQFLNNEEACQICKQNLICGKDEMNVPCDKTHDTHCRKCDLEFYSENQNGIRECKKCDSASKGWKGCSPGTILAPCTRSSNDSCQKCPVKHFTATIEQANDKGRKACIPCKEAGDFGDAGKLYCKPGTKFVSCVDRNQVVEVSNGIGHSFDSNCEICGDGKFTALPNQKQCNICSENRTCNKGYGFRECQSDTDSYCELCVPGSTFSDKKDQSGCKKCNKDIKCKPGQRLKPCSPESDAICIDCEEGTFSPNGISCTQCNKTHECGLGQQQKQCTAIKDTSCKPCGENTYSSTISALACQPCDSKTCPHTFRKIPCSLTSNATCEKIECGANETYNDANDKCVTCSTKECVGLKTIKCSTFQDTTCESCKDDKDPSAKFYVPKGSDKCIKCTKPKSCDEGEESVECGPFADSSCRKCDPGKTYSTDGKTCKQCFSEDKVRRSEKDSCWNGIIIPCTIYSQAYCSPCKVEGAKPQKYYSKETNKCEICTVINSCPKGKRIVPCSDIEDSHCAECEEISCPKGYEIDLCHDDKPTSCKKCPENTVSYNGKICKPCRKLRKSCSQGFKYAECTTTNQPRCEKCTYKEDHPQCNRNQFGVKWCENLDDRGYCQQGGKVCNERPINSTCSRCTYKQLYYQEGDWCYPCAGFSKCPIGKELSPCSEFENASCKTCPKGKFNNKKGNKPCKPWTVTSCKELQYLKTSIYEDSRCHHIYCRKNHTFKRDQGLFGKCVPCLEISCQEGYKYVPCTWTKDTECVKCKSDEYVPMNSTECRRCTTITACKSKSSAPTPCTLTADAKCEPCPEGYYSYEGKKCKRCLTENEVRKNEIDHCKYGVVKKCTETTQAMCYRCNKNSSDLYYNANQNKCLPCNKKPKCEEGFEGVKCSDDVDAHCKTCEIESCPKGHRSELCKDNIGSHCIKCNQGNFSIDGKKCQTCSLKPSCPQGHKTKDCTLTKDTMCVACTVKDTNPQCFHSGVQKCSHMKAKNIAKCTGSTKCYDVKKPTRDTCPKYCNFQRYFFEKKDYCYPCKNLNGCPAGEQFRPCSPTADDACDVCPKGSFSPSFGKEQCISCNKTKKCPETHKLIKCTEIADASCKLIECDSNETWDKETQQCKRCSAIPKCADGYKYVQCSTLKDSRCVACDDNYWVERGGTVCKKCSNKPTNCVAGYEPAKCTRFRDSFCKPCTNDSFSLNGHKCQKCSKHESINCLDGVIRNCTRTANTRCQRCRVDSAAPSNMMYYNKDANSCAKCTQKKNLQCERGYEFKDCTATKNAYCGLCDTKTCSPGNEPVLCYNGVPSSCKPCEGNKYSLNGKICQSCSTIGTKCEVGLKFAECNRFRDAGCQPCEKDDTHIQCRKSNIQKCSSLYRNCNNETNRECLLEQKHYKVLYDDEEWCSPCHDHVKCGVGQGFHKCDATNDNLCKPCPDGTFSVTHDKSSCKICSTIFEGTCAKDHYIKECTSVADASCTRMGCTEGETWNYDTQKCKPCTDIVCGQGYRKVSCETSRDTHCEKCGPGKYVEALGVKCKTCTSTTTLNTCEPGQELLKCKLDEDRQCKHCDTGRFSPGGGFACKKCLTKSEVDSSLNGGCWNGVIEYCTKSSQTSCNVCFDLNSKDNNFKFYDSKHDRCVNCKKEHELNGVTHNGYCRDGFEFRNCSDITDSSCVKCKPKQCTAGYEPVLCSSNPKKPSSCKSCESGKYSTDGSLCKPCKTTNVLCSPNHKLQECTPQEDLKCIRCEGENDPHQQCLKSGVQHCSQIQNLDLQAVNPEYYKIGEWCYPCQKIESCPEGHGYQKCGNGKDAQCNRCIPGETFSSSADKSSCRTCNKFECTKKQKIKQCTITEDYDCVKPKCETNTTWKYLKQKCEKCAPPQCNEGQKIVACTLHTDTKCVSCNKNEYAIRGSYECTKCSEGSEITNSITINQQIECKDDHILQECLPGEDAKCIKCVAGKYKKSERECVDCYTEEKVNRLLPRGCWNGIFQMCSNKTQSYCKRCYVDGEIPGKQQFFDANEKVCRNCTQRKCERGKKLIPCTDTSDSFCEMCKPKRCYAGTEPVLCYGDKPASCQDCEDGYYSPEGKSCTKCSTRKLECDKDHKFMKCTKFEDSRCIRCEHNDTHPQCINSDVQHCSQLSSLATCESEDDSNICNVPNPTRKSCPKQCIFTQRYHAENEWCYPCTHIKSCPVGEELQKCTPASDTTCIPCKENMVKLSTGLGKCKPCAPKLECKGMNMSFKKCTNSTEGFCSPCTYELGSCLAGTIPTKCNTCEPCQENTFAIRGSNYCEKCTPSSRVKCLAGEVKVKCSKTQDTHCTACPEGKYIEEDSKIGAKCKECVKPRPCGIASTFHKCFGGYSGGCQSCTNEIKEPTYITKIEGKYQCRRCTQQNCKVGFEFEACSAHSDSKCKRCPKGTWSNGNISKCEACKTPLCKRGHGPIACTAERNTVCSICEKGKFSDGTSACQECTHPLCQAGYHVVPCTTTHDSSCRKKACGRSAHMYYKSSIDEDVVNSVLMYPLDVFPPNHPLVNGDMTCSQMFKPLTNLPILAKSRRNCVKDLNAMELLIADGWPLQNSKFALKANSNWMFWNQDLDEQNYFVFGLTPGESMTVNISIDASESLEDGEFLKAEYFNSEIYPNIKPKFEWNKCSVKKVKSHENCFAWNASTGKGTMQWYLEKPNNIEVSALIIGPFPDRRSCFKINYSLGTLNNLSTYKFMEWDSISAVLKPKEFSYQAVQNGIKICLDKKDCPDFHHYTSDTVNTITKTKSGYKWSSQFSMWLPAVQKKEYFNRKLAADETDDEVAGVDDLNSKDVLVLTKSISNILQEVSDYASSQTDMHIVGISRSVVQTTENLTLYEIKYSVSMPGNKYKEVTSSFAGLIQTGRFQTELKKQGHEAGISTFSLLNADEICCLHILDGTRKISSAHLYEGKPRWKGISSSLSWKTSPNECNLLSGYCDVHFELTNTYMECAWDDPECGALPKCCHDKTNPSLCEKEDPRTGVTNPICGEGNFALPGNFDFGDGSPPKDLSKKDSPRGVFKYYDAEMGYTTFTTKLKHTYSVTENIGETTFEATFIDTRGRLISCGSNLKSSEICTRSSGGSQFGSWTKVRIRKAQQLSKEGIHYPDDFSSPISNISPIISVFIGDEQLIPISAFDSSSSGLLFRLSSNDEVSSSNSAILKALGLQFLNGPQLTNSKGQRGMNPLIQSTGSHGYIKWDTTDMPAGLYPIRVTIMDGSGNESATEFTIRLVDTIFGCSPGCPSDSIEEKTKCTKSCTNDSQCECGSCLPLPRPQIKGIRTIITPPKCDMILNNISSTTSDTLISVVKTNVLPDNAVFIPGEPSNPRASAVRWTPKMSSGGESFHIEMHASICHGENSQGIESIPFTTKIHVPSVPMQLVIRPFHDLRLCESLIGKLTWTDVGAAMGLHNTFDIDICPHKNPKEFKNGGCINIDTNIQNACKIGPSENAGLCSLQHANSLLGALKKQAEKWKIPQRMENIPYIIRISSSRFKSCQSSVRSQPFNIIFPAVDITFVIPTVTDVCNGYSLMRTCKTQVVISSLVQQHNVKLELCGSDVSRNTPCHFLETRSIPQGTSNFAFIVPDYDTTMKLGLGNVLYLRASSPCAKPSDSTAFEVYPPPVMDVLNSKFFENSKLYKGAVYSIHMRIATKMLVDNIDNRGLTLHICKDDNICEAFTRSKTSSNANIITEGISFSYFTENITDVKLSWAVPSVFLPGNYKFKIGFANKFCSPKKIIPFSVSSKWPSDSLKLISPIESRDLYYCNSGVLKWKVREELKGVLLNITADMIPNTGDRFKLIRKSTSNDIIEFDEIFYGNNVSKGAIVITLGVANEPLKSLVPKLKASFTLASIGTKANAGNAIRIIEPSNGDRWEHCKDQKVEWVANLFPSKGFSIYICKPNWDGSKCASKKDIVVLATGVMETEFTVESLNSEWIGPYILGVTPTGDLESKCITPSYVKIIFSTMYIDDNELFRIGGPLPETTFNLQNPNKDSSVKFENCRSYNAMWAGTDEFELSIEMCPTLKNKCVTLPFDPSDDLVGLHKNIFYSKITLPSQTNLGQGEYDISMIGYKKGSNRTGGKCMTSKSVRIPITKYRSRDRPMKMQLFHIGKAIQRCDTAEFPWYLGDLVKSADITVTYNKYNSESNKSWFGKVVSHVHTTDQYYKIVFQPDWPLGVYDIVIKAYKDKENRYTGSCIPPLIHSFTLNMAQISIIRNNNDDTTLKSFAANGKQHTRRLEDKAYEAWRQDCGHTIKWRIPDITPGTVSVYLCRESIHKSPEIKISGCLLITKNMPRSTGEIVLFHSSLAPKPPPSTIHDEGGDNRRHLSDVRALVVGDFRHKKYDRKHPGGYAVNLDVGELYYMRIVPGEEDASCINPDELPIIIDSYKIQESPEYTYQQSSSNDESNSLRHPKEELRANHPIRTGGRRRLVSTCIIPGLNVFEGGIDYTVPAPAPVVVDHSKIVTKKDKTSADSYVRYVTVFGFRVRESKRKQAVAIGIAIIAGFIISFILCLYRILGCLLQGKHKDVKKDDSPLDHMRGNPLMLSPQNHKSTEELQKLHFSKAFNEHRSYDNNARMAVEEKRKLLLQEKEISYVDVGVVAAQEARDVAGSLYSQVTAAGIAVAEICARNGNDISDTAKLVTQAAQQAGGNEFEIFETVGISASFIGLNKKDSLANIGLSAARIVERIGGPRVDIILAAARASAYASKARKHKPIEVGTSAAVAAAAAGGTVAEIAKIAGETAGQAEIESGGTYQSAGKVAAKAASKSGGTVAEIIAAAGAAAGAAATADGKLGHEVGAVAASSAVEAGGSVAQCAEAAGLAAGICETRGGGITVEVASVAARAAIAAGGVRNVVAQVAAKAATISEMQYNCTPIEAGVVAMDAAEAALGSVPLIIAAAGEAAAYVKYRKGGIAAACGLAAMKSAEDAGGTATEIAKAAGMGAAMAKINRGKSSVSTGSAAVKAAKAAGADPQLAAYIGGIAAGLSQIIKGSSASKAGVAAEKACRAAGGDVSTQASVAGESAGLYQIKASRSVSTVGISAAKAAKAAGGSKRDIALASGKSAGAAESALGKPPEIAGSSAAIAAKLAGGSLAEQAAAAGAAAAANIAGYGTHADEVTAAGKAAGVAAMLAGGTTDASGSHAFKAIAAVGGTDEEKIVGAGAAAGIAASSKGHSPLTAGKAAASAVKLVGGGHSQIVTAAGKAAGVAQQMKHGTPAESGATAAKAAKRAGGNIDESCQCAGKAASDTVLVRGGSQGLADVESAKAIEAARIAFNSDASFDHVNLSKEDRQLLKNAKGMIKDGTITFPEYHEMERKFFAKAKRKGRSSKKKKRGIDASFFTKDEQDALKNAEQMWKDGLILPEELGHMRELIFTSAEERSGRKIPDQILKDIDTDGWATKPHPLEVALTKPQPAEETENLAILVSARRMFQEGLISKEELDDLTLTVESKKKGDPESKKIDLVDKMVSLYVKEHNGNLPLSTEPKSFTMFFGKRFPEAKVKSTELEMALKRYKSSHKAELQRHAFVAERKRNQTLAVKAADAEDMRRSVEGNKQMTDAERATFIKNQIQLISKAPKDTHTPPPPPPTDSNIQYVQKAKTHRRHKKHHSKTKNDGELPKYDGENFPKSLEKALSMFEEHFKRYPNDAKELHGFVKSLYKLKHKHLTADFSYSNCVAVWNANIKKAHLKAKLRKSYEKEQRIKGKGVNTPEGALKLFMKEHEGSPPVNSQVLLAFVRSKDKKTSLTYIQLKEYLKKYKRNGSIREEEEEKESKNSNNRKLTATGMIELFKKQHSGSLPSSPQLLKAFAKQAKPELDLDYSDLAAALLLMKK